MSGATQGLAATKTALLAAAKAAAAAKIVKNTSLATVEAKALMAAAKTYSNPNNGFKFNLPPHNWSLPLRPVILDYDYLRKSNLGADPLVSDPAVDGHHVVSGSGSQKVDATNHGKRLSRIWFFGGLESATVINPDGTTTTNAEKTGKSLIEAAKQGTYNPGSASVLDRQYGFQFLWNPTDINISVNRNADITPSAADRSGQLTGNFQGQEQLTFSITIDRTNDFACAKGLKADADGNINVNSLANYYTAFYPSADEKTITVNDRIKELLKLGTMADIEYLFKSINGSGAFSTDIKTGKTSYKAWANGLGKVTADTGYLTSSIIAVQFGPDENSLSYTGWPESLSIVHSKFTENMIPLTSVVSVTMTCFSTHPY